MRLPKQYAIQARGLELGNRWVIWEGGCFAGLVVKFEPRCVIDRSQAVAFVRGPGVDPRYKIVELTITGVVS